MNQKELSLFLENGVEHRKINDAKRADGTNRQTSQEKLQNEATEADFENTTTPDFNFESHFDFDKYYKFLKLTGIKKDIDKTKLFKELSIVKEINGKCKFTNSGVLFFAKNPVEFIKNISINCIIYNGNDRIDVRERRDFSSDIISNIENSVRYLAGYFAYNSSTSINLYDNECDIPAVILKEAITNAYAHRDYAIKGANIIVSVFNNRIEITNPGGIPNELQMSDLGEFSVSRNPGILQILQMTGFANNASTGLNKIKALLHKKSCEPHEISSGRFFKLIFKRQKQKSNSLKTQEVSAQNVANSAVYNENTKGVKIELNEKVPPLKSRMLQEVEFIKAVQGTTLNAIMKNFKISRRTAQRDIQALKEAGLVKFIGARKNGKYYAAKVDKKMLEEIGIK